MDNNGALSLANKKKVVFKAKKIISLLIVSIFIFNIFISVGIIASVAQGLTENYFNESENRILNITIDTELKENIYDIESLNIRDNNLDLNGFTLHVIGDVTINGSGTLELNGGTLIVGGNFTYASYNTTTLNDGKVYLKGNFTNDWNLGSDNFKANIGNTFIFCGDEEQIVYFYSTSSYLGSLEITNTSSEGVYFKSDTKVVGNATNNKKISGKTISFSNSANLNGSWNGNAYFGEGNSLTEDTEIVGNLNLTGGLLNLNGKELHVTGDVTISGSGTLDLDGGTLIVDGNMTYSSYKTTILNDGKVYLKGNFTNDWNSGSDHFKANKGNTFILCGDKEQKIYFYSTSSYILNIHQYNDNVVYENQNVNSTITIGEPSTPDAPENLTYKNIGTNFIELIWESPNKNNDICAYNIYRNNELIASTAITSFTDYNLKPNTKYTYYVIAIDCMGNKSGESKHQTFTTDKDTTSPKTPQNLRIESYTSNSVTLKWTSVNDETSSVKYEIYLDNSLLGITADTVYTVSNIISGDHKLNIRAIDETGNASNFSGSVNYDTLPPTVPMSLQFDKVTMKTVEITWDASTDNNAVSGYEIYRDGKCIGKSTITKFVDTTLEPGTKYQYYVKAYDKSKNFSDKSKTIVVETPEDSTAPTVPSGIRISDKTKDSVTIVWNESKDDIKVTGYYIYRDNQYLSTVTGTSFQDTSLSEGDYTYFVKAFDDNDNISSASSTVTFDNKAPEKPMINEISSSEKSIYLSWTSNDNIGISYYTVTVNWLENGEEKSRSIKVNSSNNESSYTDNSVTYLGEYTYYVTATDRAGNTSEASALCSITVNADTTAPDVVKILPTQKYFSKYIPLSVTASDNFSVTELTIEYSFDNKKWDSVVTLTKENGARSENFLYNFDVTELPDGVIYFRAKAKDFYGNESDIDKSPISVVYILNTPPAKPGKITLNVNDNSAGLIFAQPEEGTRFAYFNIYRSENGGDYVKIKGNYRYIDYTDATIELGIEYKYAISIVDAAGNESELSDPVTVILPDDTVKPKILSISPQFTDNPKICVNQNVSISCYDNFKLGNVEVELKNTDTDEEHGVIHSEQIGSNHKVVNFAINTKDLIDGNYALSIKLTDSSGNYCNDIYEFKYSNSTLTVPILTATGEGYRNILKWSAEENETLAGFRIYRRNRKSENFSVIARISKNNKSYQDNDLNPGQEYFYKIEVVDIYGHDISSSIVSAIPTFDDDINPIADVGYSRAAICSKSVTFDASKSWDNHKIARYEWDFGDGSSKTSTTPNGTHAYTSEGDFTLTLTVYDDAGNSNSASINVHVYPSNYTETVFKIRDKDTKNGISEATVYVSENEIYNTDSSGRVTIITAKENTNLYFYKSGYLPVHETISITDNYEGLIELKQDEIITGKMEVRELEIDEIKDLGIDITKPENQNVFSYDVDVKVESGETKTITFAATGSGTIIPFSGGVRVVSQKYDDFTQGTTSTEKFDDIKQMDDGSVHVYDGNTEIVIKNLGYSSDFFTASFGNNQGNTGGYGSAHGYTGGYGSSVVTGSGKKLPKTPPVIAFFKVSTDFSWLKEFYEVSLSITNNADPEFSIENSLATLKVPSGLTLMNNNAIQDMGSINGGETKTVSWTLRGDRAGSYKPTADFIGILEPFGAEITGTFSPETELVVNSGNALKLENINTVTIDEKTYIWEFKLTNTSDKPIYQISINDVFERAKSDGKYSEDTAENKILILPDGIRIYIRTRRMHNRRFKYKWK